MTGHRVALRTVFAVLTASCLMISCGDDGGSVADFGIDAAGESSSSTVDTTEPSSGTSELSGSNAILIDRFTPTEYPSADGSIVPVLADSEPWFEFFPDGTVIGYDGCNDVAATFSISGQYAGLGAAAAENFGQIIAMSAFTPTTENSCSAEITAQATEITRVLDAAYYWVWQPPSFLLRDLRGENLLVATVAP